MWELEDQLLAAIVTALQADGFPITDAGIYFTGRGVGHISIDHVTAKVVIIGDVSCSHVELCNPDMLQQLRDAIVSAMLASTTIEQVLGATAWQS